MLTGMQVSEERLMSLLEQINNQTSKQTNITVCKFMEQINIFT
jgi:DNA-binding TFAR19-related protein (PDSD5 family)